jgi:hypothetical protein
MKRTDKDTESVMPSPHSFPAIQSASQNRDRADDRFRPLFQTPAHGLNNKKDTTCDGREDGNGNDPLAVALKESFERGVEAGNRDACSLVRQELEPSLQGFFNRLNAFSDSFNQFTHDQANHIIALALSIVAKISVCRPMQFTDEMRPVQTALDEGLRHHHQLNLQLNKDDLKDLSDLMHCRNIEMSDSSAVRICDSDFLERGTPQRGSPSVPFEALQERMIRAIDDLSS